MSKDQRLKQKQNLKRIKLSISLFMTLKYFGNCQMRSVKTLILLFLAMGTQVALGKEEQFFSLDAYKVSVDERPKEEICMVKLRPENQFGPSPAAKDSKKALLVFSNQSDRRVILKKISSNGTTSDSSQTIGSDRKAFLNTCLGCVWRIFDQLTSKTLKHIKVQSTMYNLQFNITEECVEKPDDSVQTILAQMKEVEGGRCSELPKSVVTDLDCELFRQQNLIRSQPQLFVPHLKTKLHFLEKMEKEGGQTSNYEGSRSVREALLLLERQKSLPKLEWSDGLFLAAQEHCLDVGPKGGVTHFGTDGRNPFQRMKQYGEPIGSYGENIEYGGGAPLQVILKLFIDDGVKSRGNRKSLINENLRFTGVSSCAHKNYQKMTVITYTNSFEISKSGLDKLSELTNGAEQAPIQIKPHEEISSRPRIQLLEPETSPRPMITTVVPAEPHNEKTVRPKIFSIEPATSPESISTTSPESAKEQFWRPHNHSKAKPVAIEVKPTEVVKPLVDYMKLTLFATKLEWEIFEAQNKLRTDPKSFIPLLLKRLEAYNGEQPMLRGTNDDDMLLGSEGAPAIYEAINYLEQMQSDLKPLQWNDGLAVAAYDHCMDQAKKGSDGNFWLDSTTPEERLKRYGTVRGFIAENLVYGKNTATDIVLDLLVDDGSWNRGHRRNMLSQTFIETGVAFCNHESQLKFLADIYYAEDFFVDARGAKRIEKVSEERQRIEYKTPHNQKEVEPTISVTELPADQVITTPSHGGHSTNPNIAANEWSTFDLQKVFGPDQSYWMNGKYRTFTDSSGKPQLEFVTQVHASPETMLKLNYRYQAWVLLQGEESISCTIKFKAPITDKYEKLHANIPIGSNQIDLNQWCNSTLTEQRGGTCDYWKRSACADTGDCMQNHQEKEVSSYVRCGVKRPFDATVNPIQPGDVVSFKAGFSVYDDQGTLTNWGEMQSWAQTVISAPPNWVSQDSSIPSQPRKWGEVTSPMIIQPFGQAQGPQRPRTWVVIEPSISPEVQPQPVTPASGPRLPQGKSGEFTRRVITPPEVVTPGLPKPEQESSPKKPSLIPYQRPILIEPSTYSKPQEYQRQSISKVASSLEWKIFTVQNQLRTNPKSFIPFLQAQLKSFNGKWLMNAALGIPLKTVEGPKAWKEAIQFLREAEPLEPLFWSDGLALAAIDHCDDIGEKGIIGHKGTQGSLPWDRIKRYGDPTGYLAENIAYGKMDATDIIMSLFVDDGESGRGHRFNILATEYTKTGIAFCKHEHQDVNFMANLLYAQSFKLDQRGQNKLQKATRRYSGDKKQPTEVVVPPQVADKSDEKRKKSLINSTWSTDDVRPLTPTMRRRPDWPATDKVTKPIPQQKREKIMFPTVLEVNVFTEVNNLRTNPLQFMGYLTDQLMRFEGNTIVYEDKPNIVTKEGPAAWKKAIELLKRQQPLRPLVWQDGLALAARDHCTDHGKKGKEGHIGTDGSSPWARIARFGVAYNNQGENIVYGDNQAIEIVMKQFVDDGEPDRGHRNNILNPHYEVVGIASCDHNSPKKYMTDLLFSNQFRQNSRAKTVIDYLRSAPEVTPASQPIIEPIEPLTPRGVVPVQPAVQPYVEPIEPLTPRGVVPVQPVVTQPQHAHKIDTTVVVKKPKKQVDWSAITTGLANITTRARPITKKDRAEKVMTTMQAMQDFFGFFDTNGNRKVSKRELKYVFLKKLDTDGDYSVSPRELFKGTVRFLENICQSKDFKQAMYQEDVDSTYLALGIIDWYNQRENYQNCLNGISLYAGQDRQANCNKWLGFAPLEYLQEFKSRYSLFKFLDIDEDGFLDESEFVNRAANLVDESDDEHYTFFSESIGLYGKQFCKDPRVRPFETRQSVCVRQALKKFGAQATEAQKLNVAQKCNQAP